jgi:RNA polymerase sigma factor (sigma-70 family)
MLRNPPRLLALASFVVTLGAVAQAARAEEPPPPRETQFFEKYDANLDGKVTLEEFTAGAGDAASFGLIDKNKDNVVSPDELGLPADYKPRPRAERKPEAAPGKPGAPPGGRGEEFRKRMREMDADGDGRVSRAEWKGEAAGFDRFDVNKDGFLDKDDRPAGGKGMPGGGTPPLDGAAVLARWKKMDSDGDGKVSKDEYTGDFAFEGLDTDKDGFLTEVDAKTLAERMGAERMGAVKKELRAQLEQALAALEPMDREVLALRHFEEFTNAEVAAALGIEVKAASKRYVRALERLRTVMESVGGSGGGLPGAGLPGAVAP